MRAAALACPGAVIVDFNAPVRAAERVLEVDLLWEHARLSSKRTAASTTASRWLSSATTDERGN
jgi:hypothetical protein